MESLPALAALIRERGAIDLEIAKILNRPVHSGHFGEFVASAIFDIEPSPTANQKGYDGYFRTGSLAGRTVNVKYRTRHRGMLNLGTSADPRDHPDFYLAVEGPRIPMGSTKGTNAPLCVDAVYLFESQHLLTALAARGIRPGAPTGVRRELWDASMIYPEARNPLLELTKEQREALSLFASADR
jgi:hypothetical protein